MKKILLIILVLFLTGCGRKNCNYNFSDELTGDYSQNALECETVVFTNKKSKFEFITTPNDKGDAFLAKIKFNDRDLRYSFSTVEFVNAKIRKYNDQNTIFVELYHNRKNANVYLLAMDIDGNIKYELPSTSSPVVEGENFTVREYLRFTNGEYLCANYNPEDIAYREKTYNMINLDLINTSNVKIKDICK